MTQQARELIAEKIKLLDKYYGFGIPLKEQVAKELSINDLNNTIKAFEEMGKQSGTSEGELNSIQYEIDKYTDLLNEIQNEQ